MAITDETNTPILPLALHKKHAYNAKKENAKLCLAILNCDRYTSEKTKDNKKTIRLRRSFEHAINNIEFVNSDNMKLDV